MASEQYGFSVPAFVRRNGKKSSCEPCRRAKLACDHAHPICSRCVKRGMMTACVYHPAPMTRSTSTIANSTQPSIQRLEATSMFATSHSTGQGAAAQLESDDNVMFYGRISFATALDEILDLSTSVTADRDARIDLQLDSASSSFAVSFSSPTTDQLNGGLTLLSRFVTDLEPLTLLVERWFQRQQGLVIIPAIVQRLLASTRDLLLPLLSMTAGQANFEDAAADLSQRLFVNGRLPLLACDLSTVDSFSKIACRWETIGILYVLAGLGANGLFEGDTLLMGQARDDLIHDMVVTSNTFISLACSVGVMNDLKIQLLYMNYVLLSTHLGDLSYEAYARLGDLSSALFALGLHVEPKSDQVVPFLMSEIRRRIFAAIYCIDKDAATMTGRPPRICRKFCVRHLPLDISDEELSVQQPDFDAIGHQLDDNDWNKTQRICRATWIRVKMLLGVVREDILELALGPILEDTSTRAKILHEQLEIAWKDVPSYCHYERQPQSITRRQSSENLTMQLIYLDYLYSKFLLDRVIEKTLDGTVVTGLSESAYPLLAAVLHLAAERDRYAEFRSDFMWALSAYGIPAAAVISTETVRRSIGPNRDTSSQYRHSEIIQMLSVFATCMQWIVDANPPHRTRIHAQTSAAVRQVLELVLSCDRNTSNMQGNSTNEDLSHQNFSYSHDFRSSGSNTLDPVLDDLFCFD